MSEAEAPAENIGTYIASLREQLTQAREALAWCVAAELDVAGNVARTSGNQNDERRAAAENGDAVLQALATINREGETPEPKEGTG